MTNGLTHTELVARAARWLRYSARIQDSWTGNPNGERQVRCGVVFAEMVSAAGETPDAIGWFNCGQCSILMECKVSRSDFFADQKKSFRRWPQYGVGRYRYYMTPPGLLKVEEVPDKWGLLEANGCQVRVVKIAQAFDEYSVAREVNMMFSGLRRVQVEVRTRCS